MGFTLQKAGQQPAFHCVHNFFLVSHLVMRNMTQIYNQRFVRQSIYIGKVVAGILVSYGISLCSYIFDFAWILISAFLVISPEGHDAMELVLTRIKANFVGSGTGLILLTLNLPTLWGICIGSVVSLIICDLLKLSLGARSTLAAVVIVLMNKDQSHIWSPPLHRVSSVIIGCLTGLAITFIFHSILKFKTPAELHTTKENKTEREG